MAHPQTIQIFLSDGNPRGIRIADIIITRYQMKKI